MASLGGHLGACIIERHVLEAAQIVDAGGIAIRVICDVTDEAPGRGRD
jgi:hypothetical protein